MADVDCHLRGIRTGYKVGGAEQVEEFVIRHPTTTAHNLILHHGDMRSRAAEGNSSELEKQRRQLSQRSIVSLLVGRMRRSVVSAVFHRVADSLKQAAHPTTMRRPRLSAGKSIQAASRSQRVLHAPYSRNHMREAC